MRLLIFTLIITPFILCGCSFKIENGGICYSNSDSIYELKEIDGRAVTFNKVNGKITNVVYNKDDFKYLVKDRIILEKQGIRYYLQEKGSKK